MSMISELVDRLRTEAKSMGTYGTDYMATLLMRSADTIEMLSEKAREPNCSEKPNNCEHITEDGVTCAKYPACDDCLDNPLNKVKGSERLVKGSEQTEPQTIRCPKCGRTDYIRDMEKDMGIKGSHYKYKCINCNTYIKTEPTSSKMEQVDEPIDRDDLGNCNICKYVGLEHRCNQCVNGSMFCKVEDEPQTDCPWQNDEFIPTELASTMLKERFKEQK